jgi:hypothetical protein
MRMLLREPSMQSRVSRHSVSLATSRTCYSERVWHISFGTSRLRPSMDREAFLLGLVGIVQIWTEGFPLGTSKHRPNMDREASLLELVGIVQVWTERLSFWHRPNMDREASLLGLVGIVQTWTERLPVWN